MVGCRRLVVGILLGSLRGAKVSRALLSKRCIDCIADGIETTRPATPPGPRCATHHRVRRLTTKDKAWATRIMQKYAITVQEYWDIFFRQGERCVICQRATGLRKHLSVDHDHATGFVRGLLCTPCNKMLGHLRDDPDAFIRAANYLLDPPAFAVIGRRIAPIEMEPKQPYVNRPNGRT